MGTTTAAEKIKLLESEGVQDDEFYWQFQLTLRKNEDFMQWLRSVFSNELWHQSSFQIRSFHPFVKLR